ncbi:hypothetical protein AgCh_005039 [Apium graveolens]
MLGIAYPIISLEPLIRARTSKLQCGEGDLNGDGSELKESTTTAYFRSLKVHVEYNDPKLCDGYMK